ncbi:MAG: SDR family NAD(P)-dependent oxidoreductase [Kitasatospora sp.]|jgi:nucleoside-diphosphate-sugar epimerase|nr:SDR family NAD(P)-dependent oxidoreductase [Kitasatospora sp.]
MVLVTGATGFLGGSLVSRLLADGARVRMLTRSPERAKPWTDQGAQIIAGDVTDQAAVGAAVEGAQVVYHLAGRLLVPGVPAEEYRRTHVDGTKMLLECCRHAPDLVRFVHCSTTGVLGVTGDDPADENARIRPTNIYEATKASAELLVRDTWRAGFPAVIARPGLVYGPGDLHLLPFVRSVLSRRFLPIGRRAVWLHPIYIDDLIEALVRCGHRDTAVGECFHLAGPEPVSVADLADAFARAGGTRLPPGHVPLPAARVAALLGDGLPRGLQASAPLTRSRLDFLTHSRTYDVTKASRLLDFTAPTDLTTGAARTLSWYLEQGLVRSRWPRRAPAKDEGMPYESRIPS